MEGRTVGPSMRVIAALVVCLVTLLPNTGMAYPRPSATHRLDVAQDGSAAEPQYAVSSSISGNARFVAFDHQAGNLVPGDVNQLTDVFLRDTRTGATELVSRTPEGLPAVGLGAMFAPGAPQTSFNATTIRYLSFDPAISRDGNFVAFTSYAANLVPGDVNLLPDVFLFDRRAGTVSLVSSGIEGKPSIDINGSFLPSTSGSGRFISFTSYAANIVEDDTNGTADVFVFDAKSDSTTRVSVTSSGDETQPCPTLLCVSMLDSEYPASSINDSGRYVAFDYLADDLVAEDENGDWDVFLHDREKRTTVRVSIPTNGEEAKTFKPDGTCARWGSSLVGSVDFDPIGRVISADGRYVAFVSNAYNLVPSDFNQSPLVAGVVCGGRSGTDVFVHDRNRGTTERVSVEPDGREINGLPSAVGQGWAETPSISGDGRFVTSMIFCTSCLGGSRSGETAYGPGPLNRRGSATRAHTAIYDRLTGEAHAAPVEPDSDTEAWGPTSSGEFPDISFTGRFVTFMLGFLNPERGIGDPGGRGFFRWDTGPVLGVGALKFNSARQAEFDAELPIPTGVTAEDESDTTSLLSDLQAASIIMRPAFHDVYLKVDVGGVPDVRTGIALPKAGHTELYGLRMSVDGIRYEIRAAAVGSRSEAGPSFGLFRCAAPIGCEEVSALRGGFGTTGNSIVVSIPFETLGIEGPTTLNDPVVFTGVGSYALGSLLDTDMLVLR